MISGQIAKDVFDASWSRPAATRSASWRRGPAAGHRHRRHRADHGQLIAENPGQVESWRKNPKVAGWFTGQVMKATGGKANPGLVNEIVARQLAALG